jgi:hypothetical protein
VTFARYIHGDPRGEPRRDSRSRCRERQPDARSSALILSATGRRRTGQADAHSGGRRTIGALLRNCQKGLVFRMEVARIWRSPLWQMASSKCGRVRNSEGCVTQTRPNEQFTERNEVTRLACDCAARPPMVCRKILLSDSKTANRDAHPRRSTVSAVGGSVCTIAMWHDAEGKSHGSKST